MKDFDRNLLELRRMTLEAYELRMEVYQLKKLDKRREAAEQALLHRMAKETTGRGKSQKYTHSDPGKMVSFEEQEERITGRKAEQKNATYRRLAQVARNLQTYRDERRDPTE